MKSDGLGELALSFAALSLVAIGGANAVIPEMHQLAVAQHHWLDDREFAADFALANAAPGPNVLIVTLIGFKVAGLAGAALATIAMCGPSSLLTYLAAGTWDRFRRSPWRNLVERSLAPVTVGLVFASAYTLTRAAAADSPLVHLAITAGAASLMLFTKANPLWALGAAAALGLAGIG